jgi:hypothetical protein
LALLAKKSVRLASKTIGLTLKCACAERNAMRPPFLISIPKLASLAKLDIIRTQLMTHADSAQQIAYLVSSFRILPRLFASLVRMVLKLTKLKGEFAAKIALQINTSILRDGSAKIVHQVSM